MATLAALVFGLVSYAKLPLALFPDLSYPTLTLRCEYSGAAPEEVEDGVIRPIEDLVSTVDGLMRMRSVARADGGDVVLEFSWDRSMVGAAQDLRERLDLLQLPEGVNRPMLLRYDPSLDPIVRVGLYSDAGALTLGELRDEAELHLRPLLERIEGVAAVRVVGGEEREVEVALDHRRMSALRISAADVAARLKAENINIAGGELREGESQYLVRTLHELRDLDAIRGLVVVHRDGKTVHLGDVAQVKLQAKRPERLVRFLGQRGVELSIFREADANIVATAARLRKALLLDPQSKRAKTGRAKRKGQPAAAVRPAESLLPAGVHALLLEDQSGFIQAAISEVKGAAIMGGLLAMLILYLFLRRLRTTLIAALAIPISIAIAFAPLYLADVSLNVMSLGGLALGVGMLVDNAVVVLESIARCTDEGDALPEAAARGLREVGGAVLAATLTTVAVFAPMVFVEGIAGQIFGDLAMSVVVSLLASLLVALSLIPMLASRQLDGSDDGAVPLTPKHLRSRYVAKIHLGLRGQGPRWWRLLSLPWRLVVVLIFILLGALGLVLFSIYDLLVGVVFRLAKFAQRSGDSSGQGWFERLYTCGERAILSLLKYSLDHPMAALAPTLLLLIGALLLLPSLGSNLAPELHQGSLDLHIELPVGTPLETTAAKLLRLESELGKDPQVALLSAFFGSSTEQWQRNAEGEHSARLYLRLKEAPNMARRELALSDKARRLVADIPGAQLRIKHPELFSMTAPIEVHVVGTDLDKLRSSAQKVYGLMLQTPALTDIETSALQGFPELRVDLIPQALAQRGLKAEQVAHSLRDWVHGRQASVYRPRHNSGERFDIVVRSDLGALPSVEDLSNLPVGQIAGVPIPLSAVATLARNLGPVDVQHVDGARAMVIRAGLNADADLADTTQQLSAALAQLQLPVGVRAQVAGQDLERQRAMASLRFAMLLAVFLVFAILAAQFESLLIPFLVMATVPLGLMGAVYGLVISGTPMSILALIGAITLIGIVVNNAIVLIDRVRQELDRGEVLQQALLRAVQVRLRPILMTTLTTVIALIPMAFSRGEGAEIRAPIAITLVFGLSLSAAMTLIVIPVLVSFVWRQRGEQRG